MQINDNLITYLEGLSRLRLAEGDREPMKDTLSRVLAYMEKLNKLNTEGVEELSHPFPAEGSLRADEVAPSFDRARILATAPRQKDGCFQVPRTVEG